MPSSEKQAGGTSLPDVIRPGPDVQEPIDLGANVREQRAKLPTQGVRYEARMDLLLAEHKSDKTSLQTEVARLRIEEIGHLREDIRWLEESRLWQTEALTVIGVLIQAITSFHGWQSLKHIRAARADDTRPRANPGAKLT